MLTVKIICVGSIKEKYFVQALDEYYKRLSRFCNLIVKEITSSRIAKNDQSEIKKALLKEAKQITEKLTGTIVVLDREGTSFSSQCTAELIREASMKKGAISFIIGSSHGVCQTVKDKADKIVSFGDITLPHQLFRVVLAEQIYRAFTIISDTPYHK